MYFWYFLSSFGLALATQERVAALAQPVQAGMYIALAARNNGAAQHKIPQPLARRTAIVGSAKGQPRLTNLRVVGHSQKRASSSLAMALSPVTIVVAAATPATIVVAAATTACSRLVNC